MDLGGPQRTNWPVPPDWPDGQHCQVQNDDMSARDDSIINVSRRCGMKKCGGRIYLFGEYTETNNVPGLGGGIDGGVYEGPLQATVWNRTVN